MTGKSAPKNLKIRQQRAIAALLSFPTITEAARASGISERTLYRWLKEAQFRKELTNQEAERINTAARQLVGLAESALRTINLLLSDFEVSPSVRLRTAEVVLANMIRIRELTNLEERIAKLEGNYDDQETD